MKHVVIFQRRLVHYRLEFFRRLRASLAAREVRLELVVGRAGRQDGGRQDEAVLDWATQVDNGTMRIAGFDVQWQVFPRKFRHCDLVVVTQENKIISNYLLQLSSLLGRRKVAFWGHGRNFQSEAPQGFLESWKRFWLRRVDWWFAYTEISRRAVVEAGFSPTRISVLNNTIDADEFRQHLGDVTDADLARFKAGLMIADGAPVAIYCGSLYADKRLDLLLAAADRLRLEFPGFHLLMLGAGPEAAAMEQAARERPWLHVLGMCKGAAKALPFRAASVMLNPDLVGLHVIDSFVSGCPLVTIASPRHGPEVEYLVDGANAVFVVEDTAAAYADAVARLFRNPAQLVAMQHRCHDDARSYTLDGMVERFSDGVMQVLAP